MQKRATPSAQHRRKRGFERASGLLSSRIRSVGETRGFAVAKLLTHWADIVGDETARSAHPVKVHYGRGGLGATLTVLTTGAMAPILEMQKERIREKVNACYGYSAISTIRLTQTSATGFAEGQAAFKGKPDTPKITKETCARATDLSQGVQDEKLRQALEALGQNVLTRTKR